MRSPRRSTASCGSASARDRWFASTLLSGAATSWESGAAEDDGEAATECERCGVVAKAAPMPCGCDAGTRRAQLPSRLAGKFEVVRRLAVGGMGVVYLARD